MLRAIVVALFLFAAGGGLAASAPAAPQAPPPNDDLASAAVIASLPFGHRENTREATAEGGEAVPSCQRDAGRSVWFRYTPARDGRVRITTFGSSYGAVLSAWLGSAHPVQQVTCSASDSTAATVTLGVTQGITYLIKVEAVGAGGDLVLYMSNPDLPPANDNLAAAEVIGGLPYRHQAPVGQATREAGELATSGCGGDPEYGVWYRYVPASDGVLRVDTVGSNVTAVLSAWVGTGHPLYQVACQPGGWVDTPATLNLPVVGGRAYYIRAETSSSFPIENPATALVVVNAYLPPPPPANDDLANAVTIAALPFRHDLDSAGATTEPGEVNGSCAYGDDRHGVWFKYTAPGDARVPIRVEDAQFNVVVSVWAGTEHPLRQVACSDSVEQAELLFDVQVGETYLVKVDGAGDIGGRARLVLAEPRPIPPPPTNDDLADAIAIAALPYAHAVDNVEATAEAREAAVGCSSGTTGRHGVWYRYTAVDRGRLRLHTAGSDITTVVSVWQGARHPLRELACGWALTGEVDRVLTLSVRAGQTYYIRIEGYSDAVGTLQLHVLAPPPPPAHDDLAKALDIPGLPFAHETDLTEASTEPTETATACGYGTRRGVWYRFRPTAAGRVPIRAEAPRGQALVSVWTGQAHPLQPVACSNTTVVMPFRVDVAAGTTYFIKVEAPSELAGPVRLDVAVAQPIPPRPANDDVANAMAIPGLPFKHDADTTEATAEPGEARSSCVSDGGRHGVWYRYVPPSDGRLPIRLDHATFDAVVSVWTGQVHPLQLVTCAIDAKVNPLLVRVVAGTAYYIQVDSHTESGGGGLVRLALDEMAPIPPPPANDNLADAAVISALPFAADVDTAWATAEAGEVGGGCGPGNRLGVWYRYRSPADGRVPIRTEQSTFNEVVSVWVGEDHPMQPVACSYSTESEPLVVDMVADETYFIKVEGYGDATGRLRLVVPEPLLPPVRPANDDLAEAVAIASLPFEHETVTDEATTEPDELEARCGGAGFASSHHGVWYRYSPAVTGRLRLHTQGSGYNTVVSVWQGVRHPLRQVACKDGTSAGRSALTLPVRAGQVYLIKVEGIFEDHGRLVLHALVPPPPPAHDDLTAAVAFATLPFSDTLDTDGATAEPFEVPTSCGDTGAGSVWYRYTPAVGGLLRLWPRGANMRVSVWVGTGHPLREVACRGSLTPENGDELRLPTDGGTDYFIKVEDVSPYEGKTPALSAAAALGLANDDLAQAVAIGVLPFTDRSGSLARATWEPGEVPPSCGGAVPGSWYRYTPPVDGRLRLTTVAFGSDTGLLSVWTGAGHPLREVACTTDPGAYGPGRVWTLDVRAGETYFIRTTPMWAGEGTELVLNAFEAPPRPPNDRLMQATPIDELPFEETVDLTEATREPDEAGPSCGSAEMGSVWYRYAPAADGRLRLGLTELSGEAVVSVWRGTGHPLTEVECQHDHADIEVTAGATYFVRLSPAWTGMAGVAVLEAYLPPPPAPNDDLARATVVGDLPFTDRVNTSGATKEPGEIASPCDAAGGKSVWYRLTLPETTHVRLDTRASGFDTVLSVWTGTGHPLRLLLCNDDEADTSASALTFTAEGGSSYFVRIDGLNGESGDLTLHALVAERPDVGRVFLPLLANGS